MTSPHPTTRQLLEGRTGGPGGYVDGASGATLGWSAITGRLPGWDALASASGPGARIGLLAADPLEAVAGVVAGLAGGALVAPLDPATGAGALQAEARRLGLAALVVDGVAAGAAADLDGVEVWHSGPGGPVPVRPVRGVPLAVRLAAPGGLLMSSSGTTGAAKLIPLPEAALLRTAAGVLDAHGLGAVDTGLSPLPLWHINGLVVGVLSTLLAGARLVVERRFSASRCWATAAEHGATWVNLVPAMLAVLAERDAPPPEVTARVRFARSASAPLPDAVRRRFEARTGIGVLETYGMTEAASQICANPAEPAARRPGSVGLPVDVELRVVDEAGRPLPPGEDGEVQIRGARVVPTYWGPAGEPGRPAVDRWGWLATGDLGRVDADGFVTLSGRLDDVINRGGEKISPRSVEEVLLAEPGVAAAAVVGRPHPVLGAEPVAYVVAAAGADRRGLAARLAARAAAELPGPRRPAAIEVVDDLPAGPTGKVRHAALRRALAGEPAPPAGGTTPSTSGLELPPRPPRPRTTGLTMVIDGGLPTGYFCDAVRSAAEHIDLVKLGWGTALVTRDLDAKLACLRELGIPHYFGGTLFEKYVAQDHFDAFLHLLRSTGTTVVEVSNGTIPLSNTAKAAYVRKCADEFTVLSEVGFKDPGRSGRLSPSQWVDAIGEDLEAGARLVITEARESGSSGICRADGELRVGLVEDILRSGIDRDRLLWEAPTKALQAHFITRIGPDVNLGNIPVDGVIGVETLRLGLRADTLLEVEAARVGDLGGGAPGA